ncbi:hypothetical protein ACOALA_20755 (plasmid) [Alicyclobacillus acidoterrestris]|uniref:hypothetical protein n=1 Tax=Alicyclobacillus acidoterrestris TaxID=1450 RepID=UPI003F532509
MSTMSCLKQYSVKLFDTKVSRVVQFEVVYASQVLDMVEKFSPRYQLIDVQYQGESYKDCFLRLMDLAKESG